LTGVQLAQTLVLIILLGIAAFFSASETALFSANKMKIRHLAEKGDRQAILTRRLLSQPSLLISTILIGNNVVNIGATALATSLFISIFAENGPALATLVMTVLVLIFGEITPKSLAAQNPEQVTLRVSKTINVLSIVLSPISRALNFITGGIIKLFGGTQTKNPMITEEELRMLVNIGEEEGFIDADEREMIDSIFEFNDTLVREIMVPRIDIVALNVKESLESASEMVIDAGHSRIPVYEGTIDNIVGVIYAKDLIEPLLSCEPEKTKLAELMRPAYYVPESKKVRDLLNELRKKRVHMAIVLDEYGGTAGLVTIEDLLEEIVGDIQDEYDQEEEDIIAFLDGTLLVDARTTISDLNDYLGLSLSDDEYETITGLVLHHLGSLPEEGQELDIDGLHIVVDKIDGRRVDKLKINRRNNEKPAEN